MPKNIASPSPTVQKHITLMFPAVTAGGDGRPDVGQTWPRLG